MVDLVVTLEWPDNTSSTNIEASELEAVAAASSVSGWKAAVKEVRETAYRHLLDCILFDVGLEGRDICQVPI